MINNLIFSAALFLFCFYFFQFDLVCKYVNRLQLALNNDNDIMEEGTD